MSKNKPLPPLRGTALPAAEVAAVLQARPEPLPITHEHVAQFCSAEKLAFDQLAIAMQVDRWELVAVIPHSRHVTTDKGSGISSGWMTFWKRIRMSKDDK